MRMNWKPITIAITIAIFAAFATPVLATSIHGMAVGQVVLIMEDNNQCVLNLGNSQLGTTWKFSTTNDLFERVQKNMQSGDRIPIVVVYEQTANKRVVTDLYPVKNELPRIVSYVTGGDSAQHTTYGWAPGIIIDVKSHSGLYELNLQLHGHGDIFIRMFTNDRELYDYAREVMASGMGALLYFEMAPNGEKLVWRIDIINHLRGYDH